MKKFIFTLFIIGILVLIGTGAFAQCSLCTKTAMQLGEKPALGLNKGILYLMISPFAIVGIIGYKWWRNNKQIEASEQADA
ncbi:MAG: hypothetical protein JSU03_03060 [Bacteroidetes bacterium]|nr:hypothetical protein [Bacteroidota bacterium]MBS1756235.1 hypothetical protein [Bacteroidota bacterium]